MNDKIVDDVMITILQNHYEDDIHDAVGELIHDYVDSDWEDEYDSIEECYIETGRGEAESQVLQDIIKETQSDIPLDEYCEVFDRLAEEWNLTTN